ncbi:hypothetical protein NSK_000410 [Nannochloropsis salina CCMP1776]|jgi:phytanoyl-CoA hydroxylase|uniref:Fe2OG dioxygenase domain-containing protein n=1 Tax=Nannochloropsis salina CCMP1776 TaxID=1027361 RepID=A0A4D9D9S0_9STRA|nr:hypothetical protein NSK_000410 [Nannochloropsis salina CCMP1776]|eukprot:TFJ88056.1 hypothetical protein NSK_000410 [Nannochloropsis salina CCMP1776]
MPSPRWCAEGSEDLRLPGIEEDRDLWEAYQRRFEEDGYLVLEGYWSKATCTALRERMDHLVAGFDLAAHDSVFSTDEQNRTSDTYFLESGDKIHYFWEEGAIDKATGAFRQPRATSINKVGHALHDLDPLFQKVTYTPQIGQLARAVGGLHVPLVAQSMYIFKQPRIGGKVGAHQDGTFLYTEPQSVVGFWWALEDCTQKNGCLWALPGSHRQGVSRRFRRRKDNKGTEFDPPEAVEWDLSGGLPLEVKAGALVLLHHALVHYSLENASAASRHAYSIHVVEGDGSSLYPQDNWLQRGSTMPFQPLP